MSNIQKYTVNGSPVWKGTLNKIDGNQSNSPARFVIRPLNDNDAEAMGELSADIYSHLGHGEECFIHKHQKEYYRQIFNDPNIRYIGIFAGSRLIGMSYVRICRDTQSFADEIPGCPESFFNQRDTVKIAALGADCVHPQYRGNGLNQIMIGYRLELAAGLGCSDAASIIDRSNHWNMPPYFNNGFQMFATAIDPADGGKIALMRHDLNAERDIHPSGGIAVPFKRFAIIDNLLAKGFAGIGYNKETSSILFVPPQAHQPNNTFLTLISQCKGARHV